MPEGMSIRVQIGGRRGSEGLVDLLLACHERIRRFSGLALELGRRDGLAAGEVAEGCSRCERYFTEALPLHVADEEQSLLPRLVRRRPELDEALRVMQRQHAAHEARLAALLDALRSLRGEPGAADRRASLEGAAGVLASDFEEHLALEERIVFPAVDALLPPEDQRIVVRELRARREGGAAHP